MLHKHKDFSEVSVETLSKSISSSTPTSYDKLIQESEVFLKKYKEEHQEDKELSPEEALVRYNELSFEERQDLRKRMKRACRQTVIQLSKTDKYQDMANTIREKEGE